MAVTNLVLPTQRILIATIYGASTHYYGTRPFASTPDDDIENVFWDGRLLSVAYERAVSYPVWSRGGGGTVISELEFANADGWLDSWLEDDWEDVRVDLRLVDERGTYNNGAIVGSVIIDRVVASSQSTIQLICRTSAERMDKSVSLVYSQTLSNIPLRGKARPISLGYLKWCPVVVTKVPATGVIGFFDIADSNFEGQEYQSQIWEHGSPLPIATDPLLTINGGPGTFFDHQDCYGFLKKSHLHLIAAQIRGMVLTRDLLNAAYDDFPTGDIPIGGGDDK